MTSPACSPLLHNQTAVMKGSCSSKLSLSLFVFRAEMAPLLFFIITIIIISRHFQPFPS